MRFNSIDGNTAFAAYLGLVLAGVAPSAVAAGSHGHVHDATAAATNKPAQVHADTANQSGAHRNGTPAAAGHGHAEARAADAALATEPENVQAGQPANLVFMLADATGRPLDRLVRSHARTFHVVIVSEDMAVLGHVHPEDFGEAAAGGEARVEFSFSRPGRYIVAVDFVTEAGPYAKHFLVDVGGEAPAAGTGAAAPQTAVVEMEEGDRYVAAVLLDRAEQVGGYAVALSAPDQIAAGKPAKFGFRVTRHGAPTTDLRAYLDAAMHVAADRAVSRAHANDGFVPMFTYPSGISDGHIDRRFPGWIMPAMNAAEEDRPVLFLGFDDVFDMRPLLHSSLHLPPAVGSSSSVVLGACPSLGFDLRQGRTGALPVE